MQQDKTKRIFSDNLNIIMEQRGITFSSLAKAMHDGLKVKNKREHMHYPFDTLTESEKRITTSRYRKWGNIKNANMPEARELAYLCHEVLDCDIDYLFSDTRKVLNNNNEEIAHYLDWDEESVSKIKTLHNAYKFFLSQMLYDGSLEKNIEIIYRYLQMTKVQSITLKEDGVGSKEYDKHTLIAIASHQASNDFSILLQQLSANDGLDKYILAGHSLEVLSLKMKRREFRKSLENAEKKIRSGKKTFNELCDEEEKSKMHTTKHKE